MTAYRDHAHIRPILPGRIPTPLSLQLLPFEGRSVAVASQDANSFPGAQGGAASRTRVPDALLSAKLQKPPEARRRLRHLTAS